MATRHNLETLLTEDDYARLVKRSVKTVRKDRLFGRGPKFLKLGRSVRYRPEDIARYLAACPSGGDETESE
jgi:hypothetical protein